MTIQDDVSLPMMTGGSEEEEVEPLGPISGLWRSEEMQLRSMSIERSVLERVVRRFGELGCAQFEDLNAPNEEGKGEMRERHFLTQIRSCEAIERSLRYFDEQLEAHSVDPEEPQLQELHNGDPPLGVEEFRGAPFVQDLPDALETLRLKLQSDETSLRDQVEKLARYQSEFVLAKERGKAISWAQVWCKDSVANQRTLDRAADTIAESGERMELQGGTALGNVGGGGSLGQLVGTIPTDKLSLFDRLLYRVTKGHAVLMTWNLENTETDAEERTIFRILYSSYEMQSRILKVASANGVQMHLGRVLVSSSGASDPRAADIKELPRAEDAFKRMASEVEREILDREKMISNTEQMVFEKLRTLARVHKDRRHYVIKEKAMYHCLNMMQIDKGTSFANALAWIPTRQIKKVERVLNTHNLCRLNTEDLKDSSTEVPPTHFETNEFTGTFQGIVDSYGTPRYQEVNPTSFTVITFPWLFGIMYGDVGHGLIITLAAAIMIYFQDKLKKQKLNEMVDMVFGARWLLLLMGLFATYIGFLYNDTFGMMLEYPGTRFMFPDDWENANEYNDTCFGGDDVPLVCSPCSIHDLVPVQVMVEGTQTTRCTCPYTAADIDSKYICPVIPNYKEYPPSPDPNYPIQDLTNSTLNFMTPKDGPVPFGFDYGWHEADNKLTFYNSYKMKNAVIVGVLQMSLGLFLSLQNFLYFKDWKHIFFGFIPECMFLFCTFGYMCVMLIAKWVTPWPNTNLAPNVLETMTNFFLSPGKYNHFDANDCYNGGDCTGYDYLYSGQIGVQIVLIIVAVSAVPLMLFPIPIMKGREKKRLDAESDALGTAPTHDIDMQEVWIKQVIHCIEFVLGCVSNTASYLRLWALSLAHAELSEVFWSFAIMKMLDTASGAGGGPIMWAGFGAWFSVTIGVLILMEALSAFLHALRLHWVEFQSKFYVGDGRKFTPLDFKELVAEAEAFQG